MRKDQRCHRPIPLMTKRGNVRLVAKEIAVALGAINNSIVVHVASLVLDHALTHVRIDIGPIQNLEGENDRILDLLHDRFPDRDPGVLSMELFIKI